MAVYRYVTEGSFDAYMWQALETKARFITQVITGDNAVRRAEDIGCQELSYAEVKAIASGNPAVLTLAEADAELQRLAVLKKNHADEQYLARRSLRELPETVAMLSKRLSDLKADQAKLAAHEGDPFTLGGRSFNRSEALEALGRRLDSLPEKVRETGRFPLGVYRGLRFGIVLHPNGAAEVALEGAVTRQTMLSRDSHGPRAVLNALDRLAGSYEGQCEIARRELAIAEGQIRDHEARLGAPFAHECYLAELSQLRDQLKAALSSSAPEQGTPSPPSAAELAERIKALKGAQSIEATPQRTGGRSAARAEQPVTARIRHRAGTSPAPQPILEPDLASPEGKPPSAPTTIEPAPEALDTPPEKPLVLAHPDPGSSVQPETDHRRRVARDQGRKARQLSMF